MPGFDFVEKGRVDGLAEGEEYSAYSVFVPKANSKFENKVEDLLVEMSLFKDAVSAKEAFDVIVEKRITSGGEVSSTEIQVNGTKAILTYAKVFGLADAIQQLGRLVIRSSSMGSFEAITFDEQVLKDAAILGLKAIRL